MNYSVKNQQSPSMHLSYTKFFGENQGPPSPCSLQIGDSKNPKAASLQLSSEVAQSCAAWRKCWGIERPLFWVDKLTMLCDKLNSDLKSFFFPRYRVHVSCPCPTFPPLNCLSNPLGNSSNSPMISFISSKFGFASSRLHPASPPT